MNKTKLSLFLCLTSCVIFVLPSMSQEKRRTSSSSSRNTSRSVTGRGSVTAVSYTPIPTTTTVIKETPLPQPTNQPKSEINDDNCDSYYMRCMNKICDRGEMGRCACYEDKTINNITPSFVNIDGLSIKQGFQLFDFAKKECIYVVDQCMEKRRGITEKYKNFVQRDCLMLTEIEAKKEKGLGGDLTNLKNCTRDICSVYQPSGMEDFSYPEYSLCFNENHALFSIDAFCSNIVSKSSSPLALKELFLDEMALGRERSCASMGGTMSNDRKNCSVEIKYGPNKEDIKGSKKVKVGDMFECNSEFFGVTKSFSKDYEQSIIKRNLQIASNGLTTAGVIVDMTAGAGSQTSAILGGISSITDMAKSAAYLGVDAVAFANGEIDAAAFTNSALSTGLTIAASAISMKVSASADTSAVDFAKDAATGTATDAAVAAASEAAEGAVDTAASLAVGASVNAVNSGAVEAAQSVATEALDNAASTAIANAVQGAAVDVVGTNVGANITILTDAGKTLKTATKVLDVTSATLSLGSNIADVAVQNVVNKEITKEEDLAIIKHAVVDRASGTGEVNQTNTQRGNCFLNDEWVATENEALLLLWKY